MKSLNRLGSLCPIACTLTALLSTYPVLAQSSTSYLPGDTPPPSERPADADVDTFYRELSPYGRWVNTPEYGRVWIPTVESGFQPYATNGYWIVTSYGNTWVSNYPWGWAAFHYGRWYRHSSWGWVWVPGRIWGPAWVTWRSGDGYYGWAPLGPSVTININIPLIWWTYVPQTYITNRYIYNHYIPATQVVEVHKNTTVIVNNYKIDNRTYVYGPKRQEIERVTNNKVSIYRVDRVNKPATTKVEGNTIRIYQPAAFNNKRNNRNTTVIQDSKGERATGTRTTTRQETVITPNTTRSTETRRTYRQDAIDRDREDNGSSSTSVRRSNPDNSNSTNESINRRTNRREWNSGEGNNNSSTREERRTYRQESGASDESTSRRSYRQEYTAPTMPSNNSAAERQRSVDREFSTERGGSSRIERIERDSSGEGVSQRGGGRHNRDR